MAKEAWDIIDDVSRKVRVLSDKCSTCIFHPGNRMHLSEGRLKEVVGHNLKAGALLTCHKTLPYSEGDFDPAACRGFWDSYSDQVAAGIYAKYVIGIIYIEPPEDGSEQHSQGTQGDCRHEREEAQDGAEAE